MATKKVNSANPLPISPQDLPDDGTPVSFTSTFAKNVGVGKPEDKLPTADDFEEAEWQVRRQTPEGWEFVDKVESRPFDTDLRENFGPGKYELTPIDPRTGKPVPQCKTVRLISAVVTAPNVMPFPSRDDYVPPPPMGGFGGVGNSDEMPAWMRWQMQQAAEERAEARRQAAEAAARQRDFEEKLALREFERQEREERDRRARESKEADEARRKDQRMSELIGAGVTLATTLLASKQQQQPRDVNEVLLAELREARRERAPATNGMRDSLDLLIVLDKLAQNRAEMAASSRGGGDDDDDDGTGKMMMQMLPMLLNRGGGGGGTPALSPDMVEGMMEQAFNDPALIERIAMKNPQKTARAFMQAVKQNPSLENAVLSAIDKEGGED